jgi:hypothetical protein
MSRDARRFYKQTFEIKDRGKSVYRHTMLVNPEEMGIDEPHRASVTQTLGGAYVALFGRGLHTVSLSGITGYHARKNTDGKLTDGYQEMKNFRNKVYRDFIDAKSPKTEMFWYNWEDEEYYKIIPLSLRISRSKSSPILYRYDIQFVTLEQLGNVKKPTTNNKLLNTNIELHGRKAGLVLSSLQETWGALRGR